MQSSSKKVHANLLAFLHVPLFNMHVYIVWENALSSGSLNVGGPDTMAQNKLHVAQWLIRPCWRGLFPSPADYRSLGKLSQQDQDVKAF